MKNDARFFDFLELAPRSGKPRKQGMTTIGDEGESVAWLRSMLEIWGDYADSVKFVPALLMMPARVVEERVKLYRDFGLNVGLDDPIFAIAYYQNKAEQLLRKAREMGFTHCQIDTKAVRLDDPARERKADEDQIKYSALARELGFKLWGEVGQKHQEGDRARAGGGRLNVDTIIADMKALLAEGCEQVFLENRVVREAIGDYGEKASGDKRSARSLMPWGCRISASRSPTRLRSSRATATGSGRSAPSAPRSILPAAPRSTRSAMSRPSAAASSSSRVRASRARACGCARCPQRRNCGRPIGGPSPIRSTPTSPRRCADARAVRATHAHSSLMCAARITLAHFSISSAISRR